MMDFDQSNCVMCEYSLECPLAPYGENPVRLSDLEARFDCRDMYTIYKYMILIKKKEKSCGAQ